MSLVLESTSRSQTDKVWSESCPVEKMEPDPLVGSQEETQMKQMETTHEIIPPEGGKSRKAGRTGLLSRLKAGALHWGVPSVVLNLILLLLLIIIILTAQLAKKCELCPADPVCPVATCPEGWLGYLGKCYYFSEVEANWTSSQSNCAAFNTSLAVIDSVREMGLCVRVLWGLYADLNCRGIPSGRIQLLSSPFYVTGAALPTQRLRWLLDRPPQGTRPALEMDQRHRIQQLVYNTGKRRMCFYKPRYCQFQLLQERKWKAKQSGCNLTDMGVGLLTGLCKATSASGGT
ncbi:uncharacterized protein [Emydura macquarii macquarii]|uniref:uncharacterized protein isoform X1 n=1 Tax=Emydura macquarii macquarii TaxID=1129001 RepID=UPI00352BB78B